MQEPWKLPANELAAYAAGLRAAADRLAQASRVGDDLGAQMDGIEALLLREAEVLDGFAQETIAEADAAFWLHHQTRNDSTSDLQELFAHHDIQFWQPCGVASSQWKDTRWYVRVPIGGADGLLDDEELEFFSSQQAAQDYCRSQVASLSDAVAEDLHARPDSPLSIMAAGMREVGRLAAIAMGVPAALVAEDLRNQVPAEAGGAAAAQSEARPASPGGVEGPATTPSPVGGLLDGDTRKWTPLRDLLLAQLWRTSMPVLAMHREISKLPGDTIAATVPYYRAEKALSLGSRGDAPAPTDMATLIASLRAEIVEAADMARAGKRAMELRDYFGWPLKVAQELCAEVDAEAKAA
jgi:hypothetical protein